MEIEEIREKLQGKTFYIWPKYAKYPESIREYIPKITKVDKPDCWFFDFYLREDPEYPFDPYHQNVYFKNEDVDLLVQGATLEFFYHNEHYKISLYKENALGDIKPRAIERLNDAFEGAKKEIDAKNWTLYRWQAACHIMGNMMQHSIVSKYTQDVASGAVEAADMLARSYKELLYDEAKARIKKDIDEQNLLNL